MNTSSMGTIQSGNGALPLWLRLWRNGESRSIIIQALLIIGVLLFIGWLVDNTMNNFAALGKGLSYSFLHETSGYDIPEDQQLIAYDSNMTHGRAALVGILNTLKVAIMGIIGATLLGFSIGIMRLSHNKLIAWLALSYVSVVRNVPVLLWILLCHGVIVSNLPPPKQAWDIDGIIFLTNRGFYLPLPEPGPTFFYVELLALIGVVLSYLYARKAGKKQRETGQISPVLGVSLGLIIGLPVILFFLLGMPIEFSFAEKTAFNFSGGMVIKPEFVALWSGLTLFTSAFIAEIVRAGIQAVSHGQWEAASSLGLSRSRLLQLIIIPQSLRVIIPPLTSQYLNLTKNSSLALAVGYMEVVATLGGITLNQTGHEIEAMSLVMLMYLTISLAISSFMNWYNARVKLVER